MHAPDALPLARRGCRIWEDRLAATLKLYQPKEGTLQSLQELTAIFDPQRLAEQTQLMTPDGSHLRAGGKLLFNTNSMGQLTVQGGGGGQAHGACDGWRGPCRRGGVV
jgi:hypothetical protein